jgi:glycosyltransferase involved in cell wall biosynthesis
VVASDVGGMREIVENEVNGYTVENTPGAFADKIRSILENETLYNRFSENALYRFTNDFNAGKMTREYMKIYQS